MQQRPKTTAGGEVRRRRLDAEIAEMEAYRTYLEMTLLALQDDTTRRYRRESLILGCWFVFITAGIRLLTLLWTDGALANLLAANANYVAIGYGAGAALRYFGAVDFINEQMALMKQNEDRWRGMA